MSDTAPAPMTDALRDALARPFDQQMIRVKRVPKRPDMDYVSHGAVTKRLNEVYPAWHAEMIERWVVEQGGQLHCLGGVMRLTIGGVTREEAGGPTQLRTLADDLKNTYSDCLKRCAMRFGVALDMWESADEGDEDAEDADDFLPNYGANAHKDHAPIGPPASAFRAAARATSAPQSHATAPARMPTPPAAHNGAQAATPAPALAPDDPLAGVLKELREMEAVRSPWADIKQFADLQTVHADDYGKQVITSTLHAIAARRKALAQPETAGVR